MKCNGKLAYILALALIVVLVTGETHPVMSETWGPGKGSSVSAPAVLGVDEFMKNVERYSGKRQVEGVVSAVSPENHAFSLIDHKEFQACKVTTCAVLTLPVKWRGPFPSVGEAVQIEGEVRESSGKLFFEAYKVEKKVSE